MGYCKCGNSWWYLLWDFIFLFKNNVLKVHSRDDDVILIFYGCWFYFKEDMDYLALFYFVVVVVAFWVNTSENDCNFLLLLDLYIY